MLASVTGMWKVLEVLIIVVGVCGLSAFVAYLIYAAAEQKEVRLRLLPALPSLLPWSIRAKVRRKRAEIDLARVEADLFDARRQRLLQETVYRDQEETEHRRALSRGEEES